MDLYAWIGEDELGSGRVGLKQGQVPAGMIALVAMDYDHHKLQSPAITLQLQAQATHFGKRIRLARFHYAEDIQVIEP